MGQRSWGQISESPRLANTRSIADFHHITRRISDNIAILHHIWLHDSDKRALWWQGQQAKARIISIPAPSPVALQVDHRAGIHGHRCHHRSSCAPSICGDGARFPTLQTSVPILINTCTRRSKADQQGSTEFKAHSARQPFLNVTRKYKMMDRLEYLTSFVQSSPSQSV